ncbi:MAG TPA: YceK/YidQ family lipoprotein [Caulifigura sp.]|jgi:uncharacterized protein YceK|nr:YceK/YidQ family lipoprotein [Caulifigura sp.]
MSRAVQILIVAPLALAGCGTVLNVSPLVEIRHLEHFELTIGAPRSIYGGVQLDAAIASRALRKIPDRPMLATTFLVASVMDLPLSAVGDTLTLPVTIPQSIDRAVDAYYFPEPSDKVLQAGGEKDEVLVTD